MDSPLVRRSLVAFHLVLGGGLLIGSVQTLLPALSSGADDRSVHIALLAGVEALGAVLFLMDLALFTAEHDDHHLAAITALRRRWGAA